MSKGSATGFEQRLNQALDRAFLKYRLRTSLTMAANLHRFQARYVEFLQHMVHHAAMVSEVIDQAAKTLEAQRPDVAAMFREHGREEKGHDNVARADLRSLQVSEMGQEKPCAVALEGYVRHAAEHHPLKVLGFLTAAEGFASRDVAHFAELKRMCLAVARNGAEEEEILEAIEVTAHLLARA